MPMTIHGISMWRTVGVRRQKEIVVDYLLADPDFLRSALSRKRQTPLRGEMIAVVSLEDLMLLKMLAGRLQALADLEKIEARKDDLAIDWVYVKQWKNKLGLEKR
jgi:hypothetical protein